MKMYLPVIVLIANFYSAVRVNVMRVASAVLVVSVCNQQKEASHPPSIAILALL